MNIQLTPFETTIAVLLWLSLGTLVDVLKLILATMGNSATKATGTIREFSSEGRGKVIRIDASKIEIKVVKDISRALGQIKCSIISWSTNFLRQVIEPESQAILTEVVPVDQSLEKKNNEDSYLVPCDNNLKSIFAKAPENKYAGQQIIGAIIGFLALLAFIYSDAAQGAQTYILIFNVGEIPVFLNSIIFPLVTASAGSAIILGIFIGDMLGLTHLNLYKKEETPKYFLWIIVVNLALSIAISTFIALARMKLLGTESEFIDTMVNIGQSIVILPMLITTVFLFRGLNGIYVVLAAILAALSLSFGVFEFFINISKDLIRSGLIGGNFIITRIIWLTIGTIELVFLLLELAIKGSFSVLTYLLVGVLFIPNLIFRIILRVFRQDEFYKAFLDDLLKTKLKSDINDKDP